MGIASPSRVPPGVWLIAGAVVLRVAAAPVAPLIDDEAYYWLWAQSLDWGYLDHPPMIAWLIALTTAIADSPFFVRLSPLVLGVLTTYALFLLGREMFGARAGLLAAVLFQIVPVLAGAGLLATPDAPLLLAWTVGLRFAWRAVHDQPRHWLSWGVAVGAGMLSKLPMILLPAGIALYVIVRARHALRRWELYGSALVALAVFSPLLFWNSRHGWAGLEYVLTRGVVEGASGLTGVLRLFIDQLPYVLALFPAYVWVLAAPLRRREEAVSFLVVTSLPALILPFVSAYAGAWPHGNWLAPAYLGLSVALGGLWRGATAILAAVNGAVMLYGLSAALIPVLPLLPGGEEVYGWPEAGARVTVELGALARGAAIVADRYQIAAQLGYYARGGPVTIVPCPPVGSIWTPPQILEGRDAIAVIDSRWAPLVQWEAYAARVAEALPLTVEARGRPIRTFRFYRLYGLRPPAECR